VVCVIYFALCGLLTSSEVACLTTLSFQTNIPAGLKLEDVVSLACQAPAHLKQLQLLTSGLGKLLSKRLHFPQIVHFQVAFI
jgi:hypothetical protein